MSGGRRPLWSQGSELGAEWRGPARWERGKGSALVRRCAPPYGAVDRLWRSMGHGCLSRRLLAAPQVPPVWGAAGVGCRWCGGAASVGCRRSGGAASLGVPPAWRCCPARYPHRAAQFTVPHPELLGSACVLNFRMIWIIPR